MCSSRTASLSGDATERCKCSMPSIYLLQEMHLLKKFPLVAHSLNICEGYFLLRVNIANWISENQRKNPRKIPVHRSCSWWHSTHAGVRTILLLEKSKKIKANQHERWQRWTPVPPFPLHSTIAKSHLSIEFHETFLPVSPPTEIGLLPTAVWAFWTSPCHSSSPLFLTEVLAFETYKRCSFSLILVELEVRKIWRDNIHFVTEGHQFLPWVCHFRLKIKTTRDLGLKLEDQKPLQLA